MFKIHKKIKYGLLALKYMNAKPRNGLTTAKEICAHYKIPFDPTSRVLQILAQNGILKAEQGAYGGYRLVTDLNTISLCNFSQLIIGDLSVTDCCSTENRCDRILTCELKVPMARLNQRMLKMFRDVKITEMID